MVETRGLPARFQVARLATLAQRTAVHVLPGMAAVAGGRRFLVVQRPTVAGFTLDASMRISQRKVCIAVMVESDFLPARFRVTGLAVRAVAPFVNVVLLVATDAGRRHFLRVQRSLVAGSAFDSAVGLAQRKMRIALVVETHDLPFRLGMAVFTFLAQSPFVHIIFSVATDAGTRGLIVESRSLVAVAATNADMAGAQRKPRAGMIEIPALPSVRSVTAFAVYAELACMYVVLAVAGNTAFRRVTMLATGRMAVTAFDTRMQCQQHEVSQRVIESRLVQSDDAGLAALVVSVTIVARAAPIQPSVIATARSNIGRDFLVAPKAQFYLPGLFERHVAFSAASLDIRMTLDDFSRHQQCLEVAR